MTAKGNFSRSWDWRREEAAGVSPRNSTLDVEKYEGNERGTSGNKRSVTEEGESWIGEDGAVGEDMGDTRSYLKREGNLSSDIGEEIWEKKGEKTGEGLITIV